MISEVKLLQSIMISEVKDMKSQVLHALGKIPTKKSLKFHYELNFQKKSKRRKGKNSS